VASVDEPVKRDDVVVDGLPMVRLEGRSLARSEQHRWRLLDELLDPGDDGAFVVMLDPRTALAHVIHHREAADAVGALVEEARSRGQERPRIYHLDGTLAAAVVTAEKDGRSVLDPRDAELVGRIASLPAAATTVEEQALAGSTDATIALAAECWLRGDVSDADGWCDRLREDDMPAAAIRIGLAVVAEAEIAEEEDSPYPDEERERDYDAAMRWIRHRAEGSDPAAVRVADEIDRLADDLPDPRERWRAAMDVALGEYDGPPEPPLRTLPLGPAALGPGDIEAVLWAVRKHGGAPAVIGWGPDGPTRIVDFASQPRHGLRRLLVTSADGQAAVVLDRRASRVTAPAPTLEKIRQIVASRRRLWVAYLVPRLWTRALFPSGPIVAAILAGWALAAADGEYERGVVPYFVAIIGAGMIHVLYRLVVLPSQEGTWRSDVIGQGGGPVRILGRRRGADSVTY
jgi:hypothetical protein